MQDLYLQLGIDPDASPEEIETAIREKPQLTAASDILLNAPRRAAYRRTVHTLRSIGTLRHRLGLDNDTSWFLETCPDFTPRLQSRRSVAKPESGTASDTASHTASHTASMPAAEAASGEKSSAASVAPAQSAAAPRSRSWLKLLLIVAGIAVLLTLLYFTL